MSAGDVVGYAYDESKHPKVLVGRYVETDDGHTEYLPVPEQEVPC